ncbi:hypothetical protein SH668x_003576 [Planctomicrobium sp. SH668]|uniref:hypothetical protein n=1 Tax=Planctomicrobium sp. SH668 TaxID=3448126 RepID=UPI003F5B5B0A
MSANVRNIDAIRDFRSQLLKFIEELDGALQTMHLELHRAIDWIGQDRPAYWKQEIRRGFDTVSATRIALELCRNRTVAGQRSSCIEEKVAFEKAKRRSQECQERAERVAKWSMKIQHESDEFRSQLASLRTLLDRDLAQAVLYLHNSIEILEHYAEIQGAPENSDG